MFKIVPNPTFSVSVLLSVPGGEAQPVTLVCRHKGRKALNAWMQIPVDAKEAGTEVDDVEYIGEVIESWEGIKAEDGRTELPYTKETLGDLLDNYPTAGREIFEAYVRGLTESRAKN